MSDIKRPDHEDDKTNLTEDELTETAILRAFTIMEPISANLQKCIETDAEDFFKQGQVLPPTYGFRPLRWIALAACFVIGTVCVWFVAQSVMPNEKPMTYAQFAQLAKDTKQYPLSSSFEAYKSVTGRIEWSDQLQSGYIHLKDMPENDPAKKQYQLWIVDPARDEKPVDGGVFDVKLDQNGEAIIPIDAKLRVNKPAVFAITLEQPGGVVVSKQELIVVGKPVQ